MLMDEPFGAIDPIVRTRLQDEFLRLQGELRKTVVFVTHDIDEAIKLGDRIAILREGECSRSTTRRPRSSPIPSTSSWRTSSVSTTVRSLVCGRERTCRSEPSPGGGPVIPSFGKADKCITHHHWFCTSWVQKYWGDILQPALIQHIELTLLAVGIGFAIAFVMALIAFRFRVLDAPLGAVGDFFYALPSLSLFVILLPITGLTWTTIVIPLVLYTLFILYRNTLSGLRAVPAEVLESARGMGLTPTQTFLRVELRLAAPRSSRGFVLRRSRRSRSPPSLPSSSPTVWASRSSTPSRRLTSSRRSSSQRARSSSGSPSSPTGCSGCSSAR